MGAGFRFEGIQSEGSSNRRERDVDEVKCMDNVGSLFLSVLDGDCGAFGPSGPGGYVFCRSGFTIPCPVVLDVCGGFHMVFPCVFHDPLFDADSA